MRRRTTSRSKRPCSRSGSVRTSRPKPPSSPLWTKRSPSPLPRRSSRRCVRLPRTRVTSSRQATNSSRQIQITRASNRSRRRTRRRRTSTSRCWSRWPLRSSPASCSSISTKTARPTRSATTSRALCKVRMPTSCNSTSPTTSRRRPSPTFRRHANYSPRCRASRTIGPTWRSRTRGRAMRPISRHILTRPTSSRSKRNSTPWTGRRLARPIMRTPTLSISPSTPMDATLWRLANWHSSS